MWSGPNWLAPSENEEIQCGASAHCWARSVRGMASPSQFSFTAYAGSRAASVRASNTARTRGLRPGSPVGWTVGAEAGVAACGRMRVLGWANFRAALYNGGLVL